MTREEALGAAIALAKAGEGDAAFRRLVGICESHPDYAPAFYHLGLGLNAAKRHAAAVVAFSRARELSPDVPETVNNLGWALYNAGREVEARATLTSALGMNEASPVSHRALSQVLQVFGGAGSLYHAERAVALSPEPEAISSLALGLALLSEGKLVEGFRAYEARFSKSMPELLDYPYPIWRGDPVDRLFIQGEQGIGDAIMMLRYVAEAAKRAEKTLLVIHRELLSLAKHMLPDIDVLPMPVPLPEADVFCPMVSLPIALGVSEPSGEPYIPDIEPFELDLGSRFRVGIVWGGRTDHDGEKYRAIPLESLLRLAEVPGVALFSLQAGPQADDLAAAGAYGLVRNLAPFCPDMLATARMLKSLDLLICRDTSIAHLAGAIGMRTWLLLNPRNPDWRWGHRGDQSPWYRSLSLFRLPFGKSWDHFIGEAIVPALRHAARNEHR